MLELGVELAERPVVADGHEHRIVAEAALAARRPHEDSVDPPVERLGLPIVGPCDRQRAGEVRRGGGVRLGGLDLGVSFADGEEMRTEISAKFRRERLEAELGAAGMELAGFWTDEAGDFSLTLARPASR